MNFLEKVVIEKNAALSDKKAVLALDELKTRAFDISHTIGRRSFKNIFQTGEMALIAEIKLKSPSEGVLTEKTHIDIAHAYAESEEDEIYVLTEENHFNGKLEYIKDVRGILAQPLLRKDFITDEYHVYEAALAQADAFLLIAAILTSEQLTQFIDIGKQLGMGALVEIHNEADLEISFAAKGEIIGNKNRVHTRRDMQEQPAGRFVPLMPKGTPVVSEAGI